MSFWIQGTNESAIEVHSPGELTSDSEYFWSPDSRSIAFTYVQAGMPKSIMSFTYTSLAIYDLRSAQIKTIAEAPAHGLGRPQLYYSGGEWSPAGDKVLCCAFQT